MIETLAEIDRRLFLWLNGFHTDWLDPVMYFLTHTASWIPLFLLLIYMLIKVFRKHAWIFVLGVAFTILFSDQLTSSVMKPYFARLRPSHEPSLHGMVHTVDNYVGKKYGFASSHAANTFGVALFLFLAMRHRFKSLWILFVWAFFVAYTRIYLGVHYPGDLAAGAVIGMVIAWLMFMVAEKVSSHRLVERTE